MRRPVRLGRVVANLGLFLPALSGLDGPVNIEHPGFG
jgi:hypothetical protein